jgi:DNA-binding NarL/FixJ family response regulator
MDEIRVLLADDQQMIREGIGTILQYTPGISVVGQAATAARRWPWPRPCARTWC